MKPLLISISLVLLLASSPQAKADSIGLICVNQLKEEPPHIFNIDLSEESGKYLSYADSRWESIPSVEVATEHLHLRGRYGEYAIIISRMNLSMEADLNIDFNLVFGNFKGSCVPKPVTALGLIAQRELDKLNNKRAF